MALLNMTKPVKPIMQVQDLEKHYGSGIGCKNISFDVWPGEVVGIVGESGSGKSTVLGCISGILKSTGGQILYHGGDTAIDIGSATEIVIRQLIRSEFGIVYQNPRDGLRMNVSAGGNIGERLMACGERMYGSIRQCAVDWLEKVEMDCDRIDDLPTTFSGGMMQRLQIARNLATNPRLIFMDEPTSGLDVSVQARLLDILRKLVTELNLSMIIVTHDLGVARLLANRLLVMKDGEIVECGLTDQILDDPQHPYSQLLVSSILQN